MLKRALACLLFFAAGYPLSAAANDILARFDGGIGVVPVRAGPAATTVRGVNPGGQPWVIARLSADIRTDGQVKIDGRGLLLGGGDNIGFVGANNVLSVIATLICETAAPFTLRNSAAVDVEPNGDFRIEGLLTPWPPTECAMPVLLIRSAGNGNWFAAGILRR